MTFHPLRNLKVIAAAFGAIAPAPWTPVSGLARFISPCKPPEGRERELIELLVEESAEIIQRGTKALRFGVPEVQPGQPHSNADRLAHEIGDLLEVVHVALAEGLITQEAIDAGRASKRRQLAKFMQHREGGAS